MFRKIQRIHFVGIGGIGMSGIAEVLLNLGYKVSGSDLKAGPTTQRLEKLGGKVSIGHAAENVADADVVVVSSAVRPDNVEGVEAKKRQIPVIPRAEMLAELMRLKYGVAVAGSHGKTTTTSMIATVLGHAGYDPTVVIGGRLNAIGSNARLGKGDFLVAEADESDGSFLKLSPTIAVITNIDREHLDHYADLAEIQEAFVTFANKVPFYGAAVLCLEDPHVQAIIPRIERRIVAYGLSSQADLAASDVQFENFGSSYTLQRHGERLGTIRLQIPGLHGILNSMAAAASGFELEISFEKISQALAAFQNADRRFQIKGEFTRAFNHAAVLVLLPIYAAGEHPLPGVTAERLAAQINKFGHRDVNYAESFEEAQRILEEKLREGDLLITLGAGDVWKIGDEFLETEA